ncbi:MAG: glycosyltransferase family 2 protein [Planctomycetes bacterium]|nr:glycosyltransferase family 2 protein [Planctomycetota bacterium]
MREPPEEPHRPHLSVVVPLYDEGETLPELLDRLQAACRQETEDYEVILCDDGSRDGTAAVALAARSRDPRIKLLRLSRNFGHHHAAQAGMEHARGEWLYCLDGDLQDPPELLSDLFRKARQGYDVVSARKRQRPERGLRGLGFRVFHALLGRLATEFPLEPNLGFFSLMRRPVYEELRALRERHKFLAGMRQWVGFRQAVVDFHRAARRSGESRQSLRRLAALALDALFGFSSVPVKAIWSLGLAGLAVSLLGALHTTYSYLFIPYAPIGWSSLMAAVLFMGSVQLCSVSLLGEYIWRIYGEVRRRPYHIVAERHGFEGEEKAREEPLAERSPARV